MGTKEHETLTLYVRNEIEFDEYREIKSIIAADKLAITAEIERLRTTVNEIAIDRSEIITNLRENWELLTPTERRAFLKKFVERIEIISEKNEGEFLGRVRIVDVKWK
jgi:hypothetical protein